MEKRITKKDNYNEIIKIATELGRTDLVKFAEHEIELIEKKGSNKKVNEMGVEIKNAIVETLRDTADYMTITELQNANETLRVDKNGVAISNQKITAYLTQLINSGIVVRKTIKKRAVYALTELVSD